MTRAHSYGKRLQNFASEKTLNFWFADVGFQLLFYAVFLLVFPQARTPGLIGTFGLFAIGGPMGRLFLRTVRTDRAEDCISPQQEEAVGRSALIASVSSITALLAAMLGKWAGVSFSSPVAGCLIFVYAVALILALGLGIAGRNTKSGRLGLYIAGAWFGLLILTGYLIAFIRHA